MSFVSPFAQMFGTGLQAYGYNKAGEDEEKALDTQSALVAQAAVQKQKELAEQEEALGAQQRQSYAKAGVTLTGSPLDVMLDSAAEFEFDKQTVAYNARVKNVLNDYYGKAARNTGLFKAGITMLDFVKDIPAYGFNDTKSTPVTTTTKKV